MYTHKRIQSLSLSSKSFQLGIFSLQGGVVQNYYKNLIISNNNYNKNLKDFLYQFKPITKTKIFDSKKRKRKGKNEKLRKNI